MEKVTIKDVAVEARVSIAIASFVLSNKGEKREVKPAVIKKIQTAAEKLDFKNNINGYSFHSISTKSIGLIVEDISNPFFCDLAKRIESKAKQLGYRVFYCSTDDDDDRSEELIETFLQAKVDGFIITPTRKSKKHIDQLIKLKKPVALIDRYFAGQPVSHVAMDNYKAAFNATNYLLHKGRKNIALVTLSPEMIQMQLRQKGYVNAMKEVGLYNESNVLYLDYKTTENSKINAIINFFESHPILDAALFSANYLGIAGLQAFRQMDLKIPNDVSVISFDDHNYFRLHSPSITVIEQPIEAIASKALEILMYQIAEENKFIIEKVFQKGNLVIRESV